MSKSKYLVISPLKLDGKRYKDGDTVLIDEERTQVIEPLLKAGVLEASSPGEIAPALAVIAKIAAAQTTEEVVELSHADPRKTVADAARKRLTELGAQE